MPKPAPNIPPVTPRNSESLDSGVSAKSPDPERDTEPSRESRDTELEGTFSREPERTPVAGMALPVDSERSSNDTLLSAPRPADKLELLIEDRLAGFEARLESLEARIESVERRKLSEPKDPAGRWWIWVFFLLALAIAWKALEALK